ncbi:hypothetical protein [Elizabethkingia meningoseptica]|uniref:hypothetical protein n=1 Tax=Elizabethkingia meningoseptica TaxID=238 RepID=UPI0023AEF177|nr:hypothetical protein [Elizabethkingia meningoseptica]
MDNSKVSSAEKFNTAKNVSIDLQDNVGITCTFLVSITDPRTGETTQWRETYSVNTEQDCAKKRDQRRAEIEAALEADDSID